MMNTMMKSLLVGAMMLTCTVVFAEETNVTNDCDTTYIKLDANLEPINYVNWAKEDLEAAVGELETILEDHLSLCGVNRISSSSSLFTINYVTLFTLRRCKGTHLLIS